MVSTMAVAAGTPIKYREVSNSSATTISTGTISARAATALAIAATTTTIITTTMTTTLSTHWGAWDLQDLQTN